MSHPDAMRGRYQLGNIEGERERNETCTVRVPRGSWECSKAIKLFFLFYIFRGESRGHRPSRRFFFLSSRRKKAWAKFRCLATRRLQAKNEAEARFGEPPFFSRHCQDVRMGEIGMRFRPPVSQRKMRRQQAKKWIASRKRGRSTSCFLFFFICLSPSQRHQRRIRFLEMLSPGPLLFVANEKTMGIILLYLEVWPPPSFCHADVP